MFNLRKIHRYLGVFFTPAILFFAFSGGLQTFGLHESEHRGEPPPVAWIAAMAAVHKDQHLPEVRVAPPPAEPLVQQPPRGPDRPAQGAAKHEKKSTLPLKLFVLALAIGLCVTSLVGLSIAFSNPRSRKETGIMLILGTLVPIIMLLI